MRIGLVLPVTLGAGLHGGPARDASDAEAAGLDLVWLEDEPQPGAASSDTLVAAAFLASSTSTLRLAARVRAGQHPLHIAEQAAVADNVSNGRLLLALGHDGPDAALLSETAQVVLAATAPRPFRHQGKLWTIPGGLEGNTSERRISVTPQPAQLQLPVWLTDGCAQAVARELGLSRVLGSTDTVQIARDAWSEIEHVWGRSALSLRRPAIRDLDCTPTGEFDDAELTERLAEEAESWGLDVALLRLPAGLDAPGRTRAIGRLASFVRPRLQMDRVPAIVEEHWRRELAPRLPGPPN
jgi:alkanesulfonate monooxygenase SsuD/methylene tetrahydromethanopterin reductase-like flavin-dependent oxidoreductase (luciferase family)